MQLAETRMGSSKWSSKYWVSVVKSDKILYAMSRVLKTICMWVK